MSRKGLFVWWSIFKHPCCRSLSLPAFRGCTEEYEMKTMEQKPEPEPLAVGYRPSLHQTWRWESSPISAGLLNAPNLPRWGPMGPLPPPLARSHKPLIPVPYREPQHFNSKRYHHLIWHETPGYSSRLSSDFAAVMWWGKCSLSINIKGSEK